MATKVLPAEFEGRGKINVSIDSIEISSCFDSGNLDRAEPGQAQFEYNLWTAPDCAGTSHENGNRTWFYFSVKFPQGNINKTMRFHIRNMNKQSKLYQQRMVPMFRAVPGKVNWERLREIVNWEVGEEGLILTFEYTVPTSHSHKVYFAFCYPFSYSHCQKKLCDLDQNYGLGKRTLYYHRELLCYSLEGRRIDLLTISSLKGIKESREPRLEGLFPDMDTPRAHSFSGKKVFLVSSRVHPGETPASHVFNGLLDFLLSEEDKRAEAVRNNFVVKMIPMLNPDGVARGHYRTDTRGVNLNRVYLDPDPQLHPSIFAVKSVMLHHYHGSSNNPLRPQSTCTNEKRQKRGGSAKSISRSHVKRSRSKTYPLDSYWLDSLTPKVTGTCQTNSEHSTCSEGGVDVYIDLHAHATKRGCFFYGNFLEDEQQQVENMLYPRLVALNTPHLDFEHCLFSEKNMYTSDKRDGTSKEGSGRVALYKATGLVHCYTLECNYNSGRQCNALSAATCDDGRASPALPYSPMPHKYSVSTFQNVGRALAIALLDLRNLNPCSRLPTSDPGSLASLRSTLALRIKASRSKGRKEASRVSNAQCSLPPVKRTIKSDLRLNVEKDTKKCWSKPYEHPDDIGRSYEVAIKNVVFSNSKLQKGVTSVHDGSQCMKMAVHAAIINPNFPELQYWTLYKESICENYRLLPKRSSCESGSYLHVHKYKTEMAGRHVTTSRNKAIKN